MDNIRDQRTLGTADITAYHPVVDGTMYQVKVVAYPIQIRWKDEDRLAHSPTGGLSDTPGGGLSDTPAGGLSDGAKIGLGVGLGLLGLILISAAVFAVVWWRRRRRQQPLALEPPVNFNVYPKAELDAQHHAPLPGELSAASAGVWRSELGANAHPVRSSLPSHNAFSRS